MSLADDMREDTIGAILAGAGLAWQCANKGMTLKATIAHVESTLRGPAVVAVVAIRADGYRFDNVGCSHCGGSFGPGNHGFSHCESHKGLRRVS